HPPATPCDGAAFGRVTSAGDTDFSQTTHLDGWHAQGRRFVLGLDAMPNLVRIANELAASAWQPLPRPPQYEVKTVPRGRRANVKEQIVRANEYKNIRLQAEHVAAFSYRPTACEQDYRVVVVRKHLSVEQGQKRLFEDHKYFFYITNDMAEADAITRGRVSSAAE